MLSHAEAKAKQRQLARCNEDLKLIQQRKAANREEQTLLGTQQMRLAKENKTLLEEEQTMVKQQRDLEDELKQVIDLSSENEVEEAEIKREPISNAVETEQRPGQQGSKVPKSATMRPLTRPSGLPRFSSPNPEFQIAVSNRPEVMFQQGNPPVNNTRRPFRGSPSPPRRQPFGLGQMGSMRPLGAGVPRPAVHKALGAASDKRKDALVVNTTLPYPNLPTIMNDPTKRLGTSLIELRCGYCNANVSRNSTFFKGILGVQGHMKHQHLDKFQDKQLPPLPEIVELSRHKTFSPNKLDTKAKQNAMARKMSRIPAPPLKLGTLSHKRKATEPDAPSNHRPAKKSKARSKPGLPSEVRMKVPVKKSPKHTGKGKAPANQYLSESDTEDDDDELDAHYDEDLQQSQRPRRAQPYRQSRPGALGDIASDNESLPSQVSQPFLPEPSRTDTMLCSRSTKPPVKQTGEDGEDDGEPWDGRSRARRLSAGSVIPGERGEAAVAGFLQAEARWSGYDGRADEARPNSAEPVMSGGLPDLPMTAAFVAPTARMASHMPGSV